MISGAKEEKLQWLSDNPISQNRIWHASNPTTSTIGSIKPTMILRTLLPLIDKENKYGGNVNAIFEFVFKRRFN